MQPVGCVVHELFLVCRDVHGAIRVNRAQSKYVDQFVDVLHAQLVVEIVPLLGSQLVYPMEDLSDVGVAHWEGEVHAPVGEGGLRGRGRQHRGRGEQRGRGQPRPWEPGRRRVAWQHPAETHKNKASLNLYQMT